MAICLCKQKSLCRDPGPSSLAGRKPDRAALQYGPQQLIYRSRRSLQVLWSHVWPLVVKTDAQCITNGAGNPLHACNGIAERQKVMRGPQEPDVANASQKDRRQSEPAPATAKAGNSTDPASRTAQKRPADSDEPASRPAQRPRLVAQNGLPPMSKVQCIGQALLQQPCGRQQVNSSMVGAHHAVGAGQAFTDSLGAA